MPEVSQGSSLLATLGFIAESLWDSRSLASIKIRVRCRQGSRTPRRFRVPLAGPSARQVLDCVRSCGLSTFLGSGKHCKTGPPFEHWSFVGQVS